MPEGERYRSWKNIVYQNINVASGRSDPKALEWAMQVEDDNASDEDLHEVPRRFATLSQELAAKFKSVARGELDRLICDTVEKWLNRGSLCPA